MSQIYFITENFLKGNGIISSNVDSTDYTGLIQGVSKSFIKKQIGSYFFNDLLTKYNTQALSPDEEILVEKMQFAIAWRLKSEATIELTFQLKNKGIQVQSDDNSEGIDLPTATFLMDRNLQKAILEEAELREYLVENKDLYPVFLSKENKDSIIKGTYCKGRVDYSEGQGFMII